MVSVLLATTGRPAMALGCLQSILDTKGNHEVEFVIAVDADKATHKLLLEFFRDRGVDNFFVSWCGEYRGCSKAWNDAYELSTGDPVVLAADDLSFHEGWMEAALDKMQELPEGGLVGFNDLQTDGVAYATHYMMSRDFVDSCLGGVVAWEAYRHSFNDVEATERAKRAGRFAYAPDAVVEHRHWIFGTRPQDETDQRALADYEPSRIKYVERHAAGFPD